MTRDSRPQMWMLPDIPQAAVRTLEAFRGEVRPQLLAYGHSLSPFRPSWTFDGRRTSAIHSQSRCAACGLFIVLDCDTASFECRLAARSTAALAPCAGHHITP